jgi:lipopolysaccharide/colanic/teichoic acid biosynthesis glycosyltransferase
VSVSELAPRRSPAPGRTRAAPADADPFAAAPATAGSARRAGLITRAAPPLADLGALAIAAAVTGTAAPEALVYTAAVLAILTTCGLHRPRICLRVSDQAGRIVTAALLPLPLLIMLAWTPATGSVRLALAAAGLVLACRGAAFAVLRAAHRRGLLTEQALVIGTGAIGAQIAGLLREHPELGLEPTGFLYGAPRPADTSGGDGTPARANSGSGNPASGNSGSDLPGSENPGSENPGSENPAGEIPVTDTALPVLGRLEDLPDVVSRQHISRVIVSFSGCDEDLVGVLRACGRLRADVCVVPRLYELGAAVPRACLDEVWGIPLVPLRSGPPRASLLLKRAFDTALSALLLAAAGPLVLALAVAVRLRCGPPALFRQVRVTGPGRLATIVKLRTLGEHSDPDTRWVVPMARSESLGRVLRATHLDELPQLVNVLRGQMSLVGPRPERPHFAGRFSREIPRYGDRQRMPAGMTGWAQVHGLNGDTSIGDRARFDNQYIEYWSFWLDLVILFRTFTTARTGTGRRVPSSLNSSPAGTSQPESCTSTAGPYGGPPRGGQQ